MSDEENKSEVEVNDDEPTRTDHINDDEEHEDEHSLSDHIRYTTPWKIHVYIAKCPIPCCLFMCWWFVLCGILVMAIPGLLNFSTDVPFYIPNNEAREYQDALAAGKEDANWGSPDESQSLSTAQENEAGVTLNLLYKVKDSNTLMRDRYLSIMDEIEDKVKATKGYDSYCLVIDSDDNGTCSRQLSLTNFFDQDYFKPSMDRNYSLDPTFMPNFVNYLVPSLLIDGTKQLENKNYEQEFVDFIVSYWASYDQGEGPPAPYSQKYYNQQKMPPKFYYQMQPGGSEYFVSNVFAALSDKNFGYNTPFDSDVEVALTLFSFGLPLEGYNNSITDVEEQQDDIGKWCYDELHQVFVDFAAKYEDVLEFYWDCSTMESYYKDHVLKTDMLLMFITFSCVFLFMMFSTGSLWLSTCGMAMIFMNFLPSLLLYRFIAQQTYFGTLQIMALFIILAIGADNIFVICDTFSQYRTAAPYETMDKRLTATLKHAGKVMATTSASTCFSFLANTTSLFPAVYTFGAFAAFLVFCNYCAIVLFYPTVLAVHEKYFFVANLKKSCCIPRACVSKGTCTTCFCMNNEIETQSEDDQEDGEEKTRGMDRFFESKFYPFIEKHIKQILMLTLVFFLVFFAFGVQIAPDADAPQFYPEDDNYHAYKGVLIDNFASETGKRVEVNVVWGIDGIDREGTDPTVMDDMGKVVYGATPSFHAPEEQQYIAQFCDDLLCPYSDYSCRYSPNTYKALQISDPANYGDAATNVVKCFMREFREWVLTDPRAQPNTSDISQVLSLRNPKNMQLSDFEVCEFGVFPVQHEHCFGFLFGLIWLNEEIPTSNPDYASGKTNYDYWKSSLYAKETDDETEIADLKFFFVSVLTEGSLDTTNADGIQLYYDWRDFGQNWKDNVLGTTTVDKDGTPFVETPDTLQSIMVTDAFLFGYYFIQARVIYEAFFGIGLSLCLAFIILSIATNNVLMALYSTFVIFVIVMSVIGFTVMNGWKLGVIEAVLYVMVVGMAVDYVVHLSEAYLASGKRFRKDRARRMLGIVGGSVLSGAMSTLIGIVWLLGATNYVFYKFGAIIFFLIATSLVMSMVSFTAAMSAFGPEGTSGNLWLFVSKCWACLNCRYRGESSDNVEMA